MFCCYLYRNNVVADASHGSTDTVQSSGSDNNPNLYYSDPPVHEYQVWLSEWDILKCHFYSNASYSILIRIAHIAKGLYLFMTRLSLVLFFLLLNLLTMSKITTLHLLYSSINSYVLSEGRSQDWSTGGLPGAKYIPGAKYP